MANENSTYSIRNVKFIVNGKAYTVNRTISNEDYILYEDPELEDEQIIVNTVNTTYICDEIPIDEVHIEAYKEFKPTITFESDVITEAVRTFADDVFKTAEENGKYESKPDLPPLIMHVISELTEAVQSYLCNEVADYDKVQFALKNLDNPMYRDFFRNNLKSKFEDEIADAILVLFSIAGYMKIDIATHMLLKNNYNKLREEHSVFNQYK